MNQLKEKNERGIHTADVDDEKIHEIKPTSRNLGRFMIQGEEILFEKRKRNSNFSKTVFFKAQSILVVQ